MEFNSNNIYNKEKSICNGEDNNYYSFKAKYYTFTNNEKILLLRNISLEILEMIVDGQKVNPSFEYTFPLKGYHNVYILLNNSNNNNSLYGMFSGITSIKSIFFSPLFDTKDLKQMSFMFYGCSSLIFIDLSNLNTQQVTI